MRRHDRPLHDRLLDDEDGIALVFAMLAIILLGGLSLIFVGNAVSQSRASSESQSHEQALHVAEAGIDRALVEIADDDTYDTGSGTPSGDEAAWARSVADAQAASDGDCSSFTRTAEGDAFHVVLERPAVTDPTTIYGVGYLPDCLNPREVRVVRVETEPETITTVPGPKAIVSAGDILLDQNTKITGGVHANGTLTYNGSSNQIDEMTATTCAGNTTPCTSGAAEQEVVNLEARDFWDNRDDPAVSIGVPWYDLCEGGAVYTPTPSSTEPCDTVNGIAATVPTGWYWDASDNQWVHDGNSMDSAVYYAMNSNLRIKKSPQGTVATFLVEADVANDLTPASATTNGDRSGNFWVEKNPKISPAWPGVGIVADVDIVLEQNGAFDGVQALMYAHEQIEWQQNHKSSGAFFIGCDESLGSTWSLSEPDARYCPNPSEAGQVNSTGGSPISTSVAALQNMEVNFDNSGVTLIPGSGEVKLGRWRAID